MNRVSLLQLHNSITASRGDEPTSLTPADVLGTDGLLDQFRRLRDDGLVEHFGLTGIGQPDALREVINSGEFATIQTPFNLLNPSAGSSMPRGFAETDYGNIIADCAGQRMGVFAIRVFCGGALVGNPPAAHTYKTKFFPADLYQRDIKRRERLLKFFSRKNELTDTALRFTLSHPDVTSAIIGFSAPEHVDQAVGALKSGPLPADRFQDLCQLAAESN